MVPQRIRSASVGACLFILGAIGATGSAQAAVYTGSWDPAFGGIFGELGWGASATLNVPAACLAQTDASYHATGACAGFSVLSAKLDFFNVAAPGTVLESFDLDTSVFVNGIDIAGGQFVGIDTGFFGAVVPTGASLSIAGDGAYAFSLVLYNGTQAQLVYTKPTTASPLCAGIPGNATTCGYSANAAVGTITLAVPEPETYLLMLAGLGVVGWAARRKSRAITAA